MGTSISADILNGLYGLADWLFHSEKGVSATYVTTGDGAVAPAIGVPHKILENVDRRIPAFTISNTGSAPIKVGPNGTANFTVAGGTSLTYRWKNPAKCNIVYNDQGNSAIVIEVTG